MPITDYSIPGIRRSLWAAASVSCLVMLGACVETMPKLPVDIASFGAKAADLEGTWSGSYVCSQGHTAVRLLLKSSGPQTVEGRYEFFNLPGQSNSAAGSFAVAGTVNLGQLKLKPGSWIVKPANYMPLSLSAAVFRNPDRLVGNITEKGCGRFEVARTSLSAGATGAAAVIASNRMPEALPQSAASTRPVVAPVVSGYKSIGHAEFVKRLGTQKLPSLVGTALQLNLRRGGDGGWDGYVEDPRSLVFFECKTSASGYQGGPTTARVSKLKSNDNGVYATLDRCSN